jgi:hypothetical protein
MLRSFPILEKNGAHLIRKNEEKKGLSILEI